MATRAPDETDILCENCGYMLNGLPTSGNCPECGSTIEISLSTTLRNPPLWELIGDSRPIWLRFLITTAQIIFAPTRFYRTSTSRGEVKRAQQFATVHWIIWVLFTGLAAWAHWDWYERVIDRQSPPAPWLRPALLAALPVGIFLATSATIRLAAALTVWEAAYRGLRLPRPVVLRALYYHSAHFFPVALMALITCGGYDFLQRHGHFQMTSEIAYLYILSLQIVLSAVYLFVTYWIGMRNVMYANR
jgi:hypothetical protein